MGLKMVAKPKLKIDWPSVIKGLAILLAGLGTVGTGTVMLGGNESDASEVKPKLEQHMATDSVRWVYTEKRLERIESDIQQMIELQRETLREVKK